MDAVLSMVWLLITPVSNTLQPAAVLLHVMPGVSCPTVQCSGYRASCPVLPLTATRPPSVSTQYTPLELSSRRHCGSRLPEAVMSWYRSSRPSADMASSVGESGSKLSCVRRRAAVGTRTTGVQEFVSKTAMHTCSNMTVRHAIMFSDRPPGREQQGRHSREGTN